VVCLIMDLVGLLIAAKCTQLSIASNVPVKAI
jgi:hypothetical protein